MQLILDNFKDIVRGRMGITSDELPNLDIEQSRVEFMAAIYIKKRVPEYETVVDETDEFLLQEAAMNYICFYLCPRLGRLLDKEVKSADLRWVKQAVNWEDKANYFIGECESNLMGLTTVSVEAVTEAAIFKLYSPDRETI
jgi:hypothetical protein